MLVTGQSQSDPVGHFATCYLVCQLPTAAGRRANSRQKGQPPTGKSLFWQPPVVGQSVVRVSQQRLFPDRASRLPAALFLEI